MKITSIDEIPSRATIREEFAKSGHGPYKVAYWKEKGKLKKVYIGKSTDELNQRLAARASAERLKAAGYDYTPAEVKRIDMIRYWANLGDLIANRYWEKMRIQPPHYQEKGNEIRKMFGCNVDWAWRVLVKHLAEVFHEMDQQGLDYKSEEAIRSYLKSEVDEPAEIR